MFKITKRPSSDVTRGTEKMLEVKKRRNQLKRRQASCQAGHLTVAAHFQIRGSAWLRLNKLGKGSVWSGHCKFNSPGNSAISIAGLVGECLDDVPTAATWEIVECWQNGLIGPHPSDMKHVPACWKQRRILVEEGVSIINKHKPSFQLIIEELLTSETISF